MKCPNCGAKIGNKKACEYCGAQISIEMIKEQEQINKQGCPKCGSTNIKFNRENQGEIRGKNSKQIVHRTVGFCQDCGHTWYPNSPYNEMPKKNNLVWWILGWLFFFPAPIMILIWRKKNTWDIKVKIAVTVIFWIIFFIIGLSDGGSDSSTKESNTPSVEVTTNNGNSVQASADDKSNDIVVEQVTNKDNESAIANYDKANSDNGKSSSVEEALTELEKSPEELYFEQVKHDVEWQMMPRDECESVVLEDGSLKIKIHLSNTGKILERYTDISNAILAIKSGYDWWDTLVIDFGSSGVVTKTKDDLVDGDFEITKDDFIKE